MDRQRQFPGEVERVLHPRVHAHAPGARVHRKADWRAARREPRQSMAASLQLRNNSHEL
jgi:hypothetical protein